MNGDRNSLKQNCQSENDFLPLSISCGATHMRAIWVDGSHIHDSSNDKKKWKKWEQNFRRRKRFVKSDLKRERVLTWYIDSATEIHANTGQSVVESRKIVQQQQQQRHESWRHLSALTVMTEMRCRWRWRSSRRQRRQRLRRYGFLFASIQMRHLSKFSGALWTRDHYKTSKLLFMHTKQRRTNGQRKNLEILMSSDWWLVTGTQQFLTFLLTNLISF